MNATAAALLLGTAIVLMMPREVSIRLRDSSPPKVDGGPVTQRRVKGAAGLAGLAVWLLGGGGVVAAALGVAVFVVMVRFLTQLMGGRRIESMTLQRQAAEAAELMAACLASGATLERTTTEVAKALNEPIAGLLREASALMSMGASVQVSWGALIAHGETAPIGRAVIRSTTSGAPSADALLQLAADLRSRRHAAAQARVRSVAVATVGPLGLCFLPAFLLLGVVPIVVVLIDANAA